MPHRKRHRSGLSTRSINATPGPSPEKSDKSKSKVMKIPEGFTIADLDEYIIKNVDLLRRRARSVDSDQNRAHGSKY